MIRAVFVCIALLVMALLVSGCATGQLSEAEQQSLAAAASGPAKLQPGDKIKSQFSGKTSSAAITNSIRVAKSHYLWLVRLRRWA